MLNIFFIFAAKYLFLAVIVIAVVCFLRQAEFVKKRMMMLSVISLPLTYIVAKIAGHFYNNPRPFVVGHFTPLIAHVADNGFPSDHTLICAAFASIIFPYNKKLGALAWFVTMIVGFSRMYVGVHHPVDIIGSITIASLTASFAYLFLTKKWTGFHEGQERR